MTDAQRERIQKAAKELEDALADVPWSEWEVKVGEKMVLDENVGGFFPKWGISVSLVNQVIV